MSYFNKIWFWQFVGGLLIALIILVGVIITGVKRNTDYLLYRDATTTARKWARYLTESVIDLGQIGSTATALSDACLDTSVRPDCVAGHIGYEVRRETGKE
jgi:hypothetical protein